VHITGDVLVPDSELHWSFVRSSGPGGQNVNKVASKAVLRWNVATSAGVPEEVKARLRARQRRRITTAGELILSSQRFRDQKRNQGDCLEKLRHIVLEVLYPPRQRKKTRPSRAAHEKRIHAKKRRSGLKAKRRRPVEE
jgi:ribosome-associated protein